VLWMSDAVGVGTGGSSRVSLGCEEIRSAMVD
jgi:hypothetical protein